MDDLVENVGFVCLCTQMWNPTEFQLPPINNKVPRTKTARLFQHCKPSHCVKSNNWPLCTAAEGIKTLLNLNFMQIWNVSITRRLFKSNKAIARLQHAIKAIAAQMLHYNGPRFSILTQTHFKKQNAAVSPVSINHDLIWYDISGLISKCGRTMWR